MKLRIAHCLETVGLGGVEQTRLLLARGLDHETYEQILICTKTVGALPEQFCDAGTPLHRIGVFRSIIDPQRYRNALQVIREFRPHILHGAVYEGIAVAAICGNLARVPIIVGEETSEPFGRSWRGHLLLRALMGLTNHSVAVSPIVEDYLVDWLRVPRTRVSLINNGVSPPRAIDAAEIVQLRAELKIDDHQTVIGTVGRLLNSCKRQSDLLVAFRLLCNQRDDLRLLIVGDGPDRAMLEGKAEECGIADRTIFTGYIADTRPFYRVMDIFALPSAYEAFGLVLVEAMYARLPIVATNVGGIPFVVVESETGFLVPPNDPCSLADRLMKLAVNPTLRSRFGIAGAARAEERFSAERYVHEVDALYRRLADANPQTACLGR